MSAVAQALRDAHAPDWPEPEPLPEGLPPVDEINPALLPRVLRPWVLDVAERVQVPLDYPAVGCLVALAAVVGRQVTIRPKRLDDWTVTPNLWGGIVGRPGLMKTPALAEMMKPLQRLEARARERHEHDAREHGIATMLAQQEAKAAAAMMQKALKAGDQAKAHEIASAMGQAPPAPERTRYISHDPTVPKLGELLAANPRGVLVFRDELTGWLASLEREGSEGDRAFYLEAWNGTGAFTWDRIGRGTVDIEAACVSVLGGIQPGPLSAFFRGLAGRNDDGLLQRLQVVAWPDPPATWRNVDRVPDRAARDAAFALWDRLDVIDAAAVGADCDGPLPYLRFDPEGQEVFDGWREGLEGRLLNDDLPPAFASALAKQRSLAPSIALLTHLADHPEGGPVGAEAACQAVAWCAYLESHAGRVYSPALQPETQAARALAARLPSLAGQFTARDVYRRNWAGLDRASTDQALACLVDYDWLRAAHTETGGRPSIVYQVNPRCRR